jgi:hypothetical protein
MTGRDGAWVAMPSVKRFDRDGNPVRDANGKPIYDQIVEFRDKATADRFSALIIELVRREHPNDLEGVSC